MKSIRNLVPVGVAAGANVFVSRFAFAADPASCNGPKDCVSSGITTTGVNNGGTTDFTSLIHGIVNLLLFIVGVAAVIMLIIGGLLYVVSSGDSKRVETAKNTILYAVIGIVVALAAGAIVNWIFGRFA